MTGSFILLTGGSGQVGYNTLVKALEKGHKVRAAVRTEAKAETLKAAKSVQPYLSQLSFAIVPDIEKDGAFDEAVKGVDGILHVASPAPRPSDNLEQDIVQPAINGTVTILYSALKEPSVKRVVITSSIIAVMPSEPKVFTADNIEPDPKGPYANAFAAYGASKKLAYACTRDFIVKENPHFTVVNVMPSVVIGKNELASTPDEITNTSNGLALGPVLGKTNAAGFLAAICSMDDVAYVHVAALNPNLEGNRNLGVNYDYTQAVQYDDAIEIVRKHFPAAVEKGIFPLGGSTTSLRTQFDASETERLVGIKFKGQEEMIKDVARWYVAVS